MVECQYKGSLNQRGFSPFFFTGKVMNKMSAYVIGAGVIGINTAHRLAADGFNVTVFDSEHDVALDTSYRNGGQLSVGHCVPWSNPSAPAKVLKWLFQKDAPLLFTPRFSVKQLKWIANFFRQCTRSNTDFNTESLINLGMLSRDAMQNLQAAYPEVLANEKFSKLDNGIIHFYRNEKEYNDAVRDVIFMNGCDLERKLISREKVFELEPSLQMNENIIGGTYTPGDASCDVHQFTKAIASITEFPNSGGSIRYKLRHYVRELVCDEDSGRIVSLTVYDEDNDGIVHFADNPDVVVVAAANSTYDLVKPLGINLTMYPAKGYSATIKLHPDELDKAPYVSLTDDENKLVFSRLGDTLRVAGTAHLTDEPTWMLDMVRCNSLIEKTRSIFDIRADEYEFWSGARPLTPSNRPYICSTDYENLFLNTGHGSLGLTMSAGSAELLSYIIANSLYGVSMLQCDEMDAMVKAFSLDIAH
jgi:D-amino-acid dehydrogenase